jgi:hypothetical protein
MVGRQAATITQVVAAAPGLAITFLFPAARFILSTSTGPG